MKIKNDHSNCKHNHNHDHAHEHSHNHHNNHDHKHDGPLQGHSHSHSHGHGHSHGPVNYNKAFFIGIILNVGFIIIEIVFGLLSNSLALIADASHNISDVLGLIIAWIATHLVKKEPNEEYTYGYKSSSILAALFNGLFLLFIIGGVTWEAISRFKNPQTTTGSTVIFVALAGVFVNGITALMLRDKHNDDLNIKGAYLHMLADALISVGVAVSGIIMLFTNYKWIDPVVSILVNILIFKGTWGLVKNAVKLALNAVPEGVDRNAIAEFLQSIPEVSKVHDLHVWGLSTTESALTVHLVMPKGHPGDRKIHDIEDTLARKYKIAHSTIQIEIENDPNYFCKYTPDNVL